MKDELDQRTVWERKLKEEGWTPPRKATKKDIAYFFCTHCRQPCPLKERTPSGVCEYCETNGQ